MNRDQRAFYQKMGVSVPSVSKTQFFAPNSSNVSEPVAMNGQVETITAAPQAKAPVFGRMAAKAQGKAVFPSRTLWYVEVLAEVTHHPWESFHYNHWPRMGDFKFDPTSWPNIPGSAAKGCMCGCTLDISHILLYTWDVGPRGWVELEVTHPRPVIVIDDLSSGNTRQTVG